MASSIPQSITGVVLAGGRSHRMGRDKAALFFGGETLLARAVRLLGQAASEVIVVGSADRAQLVPATRIVPDALPGQGPLGGIVSALRAVDTPRIFVVACDMPFLRPEFVRWLVALSPGYDVVVPRTERGIEPLHAVYGQDCLVVAESCMRAGDRAIASLVARMRTRIVEPSEWEPYDPTGWALFNANTASEWDQMLSSAEPD